MKILSIGIENFLTIKDADLNLDNRGLVLIQGVNKQNTSAISNGAGKSSIADALCWALYGETARGVGGDAVVNRTAKKDCRVSILIEDGPTTYNIVRHRKHKTGKNSTFIIASDDGFATSVNLEKGKSEAETQKEIERILGCPYEVFKAAIYAGQEEMPDLPKMTDKALKGIVELASGVDRLEAAKGIAMSMLTDAKRNSGALELKIADAEGILKSREDDLSHTAAKQTEYEHARIEEIETQTKEADAFAASKHVLILGLSELPNKKALEERAEEIKKEINSFDSHFATSKKLGVQVATAGKAVATRRASLEIMAMNVKKRKDRIANAPEQVKKPCESCGKPGDEHDLETYLKHQNEHLEAEVTALKAEKEKFDEAVKIEKSLAEALHRHEEATPDTTALSAELSEIHKKLLEIKDFESKIEKCDEQRANALAVASKAKTAANPYVAICDDLRKRISETKKYIEELKEKLDESNTFVTVMTEVVAVYGPGGVRAHILDTVTPFLNERTADYLSALTDGNCAATWNTLTKTAKGELREKFNIDVTDDQGAESYMGLSGGEKRKVRLATVLALQDLVASRATKPIDIWIGDEIDDSLDEAGLERLMGILERKAKERGTVLIVSHRDLQDWCDSVTTVTKEDGYSTIEGALCV